MLGYSGIQSNEDLRQRLNLSNNNDEFTAKDIKVLLVDHDPECLQSTAQMLELCSYKVSKVEFASTALSMVSHGKHFDVVMANILSPDCKGFTLLEKAVSMKTLVILMCAEDEENLARNVLEKGAFLLIRKPVSLELGKSLWQHVMRERLKNTPVTNTNECQEAISSNDHKKNKSNGKKNARVETSPNKDRANRRKIIEWTSDLHFKFMDAVYQLGEGRCYPKDILERMNVPGLTRLQVASHLQKCRNEIWQAPEVRKNLPHQHRRYHPNNGMESGKTKERLKKFGIMPPLHINPNHEENKDGSQRSDESNLSEFFDCRNEEDEGSIGRPFSQDSIQPPPQMPIGLNLSVEKLQYCNAAEYGNVNIALDRNENQQPNGVLNQEYCCLSTIANEGQTSGNGKQIEDDFFEFPDVDNIIMNYIDWNQGQECNDGGS